jgi:hypothetical protein
MGIGHECDLAGLSHFAVYVDAFVAGAYLYMATHHHAAECAAAQSNHLERRHPRISPAPNQARPARSRSIAANF